LKVEVNIYLLIIYIVLLIGADEEMNEVRAFGMTELNISE